MPRIFDDLQIVYRYNSTVKHLKERNKKNKTKINTNAISLLPLIIPLKVIISVIAVRKTEGFNQNRMKDTKCYSACTTLKPITRCSIDEKKGFSVYKNR